MNQLALDLGTNFDILLIYFSYVLTQILSSDNQDREQVVENIHNYLRTVGEETRKGLIPMDKFVVNKVTTYL
jgi:DNA polymerase alpha subunit A